MIGKGNSVSSLETKFAINAQELKEIGAKMSIWPITHCAPTHLTIAPPVEPDFFNGILKRDTIAPPVAQL